MQLERFDPAADAGAVRACHEISLAAAPIDEPHVPPMSPPVFRGWMMYGWTEDPSQCWLARDAEQNPVAWYRLSLPQRENRDRAHADPQVHPSRRRAGRGRALLRHAAARAEEAGRTLLAGSAREGSAGDAFARAVGARHTFTEINRVLRVGSIPPGRLAVLRQRAEPATGGYSLVSWKGPVPGERLGEVAEICLAMADAPREEGAEADQWDADRVRQMSERAVAQGLREYTVAAQEQATGKLVAITQLCLDPLEPAWGFQELTVVTRSHRGHRLGMVMKVAMLELLAEREPQLAHILTGNADGNQHMIAINTELGFEVLERWSSWELPVSSALGAGRS
jgi:GNAT superfamily N-acetyltransferase